jgi:hypothetical protein
MHDVSIVLACENVTGAAHVRCQLIYFVKSAIHNLSAKRLIPKIPDDEIVRLGLGKCRKLQVNPAYPEAFSLEPLYEMTPDKPSGTANQSRRHGIHNHRGSFQFADAA